MARELREVVYVDGVRTAFGRAGENGLFWKTRADDMAVKAVRELLRRNPQAPPDRIGDVNRCAIALQERHAGVEIIGVAPPLGLTLDGRRDA